MAVIISINSNSSRESHTQVTLAVKEPQRTCSNSNFPRACKICKTCNFIANYLQSKIVQPPKTNKMHEFKRKIDIFLTRFRNSLLEIIFL